MRLFVFALFILTAFPAFAADGAKESAYDRVMRTDTIRCGYLVYAPYIEKDPNTGKMSGIFYDIMEEIGKNASLKIDWAEEVGYENIFSGLDAGRYDVFCGGLWPNAARAKAGAFSIPAFFSTITAWGKAGDARFRDGLDKANVPDVRIAVIDGSQEDVIARTDFPKALRVSSPTLSPFTDNFDKIASGKADLTFVEPSLVKAYVAANPGSLAQISPEPLRVFGNTLAIGRREGDLKDFLNIALQELLYNGSIDKILTAHEKYPGSFQRAAKPYEASP